MYVVKVIPLKGNYTFHRRNISPLPRIVPSWGGTRIVPGVRPVARRPGRAAHLVPVGRPETRLGRVNRLVRGNCLGTLSRYQR